MIHSIKKIEKMRKDDKEFDREINRLIQYIQ